MPAVDGTYITIWNTSCQKGCTELTNARIIATITEQTSNTAATCFQTDDILSRAVNISVGVVDKGLGANFGIDITTDNAGIDSCAQKILTFLKANMNKF